MRRLAFVVLFLCAAPLLSQERPRTENVIIVTLDGFRVQEFFGGADETLMDKNFGGVKDLVALKAHYWRNTPEERRAAVLPFLWGTVAKQGQIFGDRSRKSAARLTNGL